MNKLYLTVSTFCLLFFFGGDLLAQTVKITGEIRPRYEYRHGYKTLFPDGANPANFVSQRTRLNGFFANETFKAYVSLQDVRVWGDVAQLNKGDVYGFSVHEAWGQVKFCDVLSLKVGRQEVSYDDQRMFGAVGWAQQARSHDAAVFKFFFGDNNKVDLGLAYNSMQESLYKVDYTNKNYKFMQWVHYHGNYGKKSGLSILVINNGIAYDADADTDTAVYNEEIAYTRTAGGRYSFKGKKIKFNAAIYWQGGKTPAQKDMSSYYFGGDISFHLVKGFSFGLGGEYLSGNDMRRDSTGLKQVDTQKDYAFTPYYGTNHKFNGWMDYFYVGNHAGNSGLIDIYIPLVYKVKKVTFKLIPHYFMSAGSISVLNSNLVEETYSNGLGTEIDFSVGYAVSKSVVIAGGYSQMFATETMQVLKGGNYQNTNNWGWIMITFKPTFFNSDNKK